MLPSHAYPCHTPAHRDSLTATLVSYRKSIPSSIEGRVVLLQGRSGRIRLVEVRACYRWPFRLAFRHVMQLNTKHCEKPIQRVVGLLQDVEGGVEVGSVSTQGHPLKSVWDAALLLHGMGYLHFKVSKPWCAFALECL